MFHLLVEDESAAREIESEILKGSRIHFGLDAHIVGMIAHSPDEGRIHVINVSEARIIALCLQKGQSLKLVSLPKEKQKSYEVVTLPISPG
jgi:hypothetical protein